MAPRARPMTPEDRREAIVEAVLPLVATTGSLPSTREIAEAAGVAQGTIFSVFADKRELGHALAERALNPPEDGDGLVALARREPDLRARVEVVTAVLQQRMRLITTVLIALRQQMVRDADHDPDPGRLPGRDGAPQPSPQGPPDFVVRANRELLERLTEVFALDHDRLRVDPATAAMVLRSIVFGSQHPGMTATPGLSPAQIADVVVGGVGGDGGGIGDAAARRVAAPHTQEAAPC